MTKNLRELFSNRLKEALKDADMSQNALAKSLEVSPTTVQRWISQENWPNPDSLQRLAYTLGKDPSWFISDLTLVKSRAEKLLDCFELIKGIKNLDLAHETLEAISEGENGSQSRHHQNQYSRKDKA